MSKGKFNEPWNDNDFTKCGSETAHSDEYEESNWRVISVSDLARAINCTNACAGLADPAADIEELVDATEGLIWACSGIRPMSEINKMVANAEAAIAKFKEDDK
ncbi:MAG: hypothetical protein JRI80_00330 [Deltaproteobacteria bacterium]|nr:hypothetical protein [Deltaproteobacteria bacterium]